MGDVFVLGAATTRFGRAPHGSLADLISEAAALALEAGACDGGQIAEVFVGCRETPVENADDPSPTPRDEGAVQAGLRRAGVGVSRRNHHQLTRSAALALHRGWRAVDAGEHRVVLCVGAERLATGADVNEPDILRRQANAARAYLAASGATVEHLARAAVKNYRHGARNPAAPLRTSVPLRTVLDSEPLEWPLTRMMVARRTAGAAALVLSAERPSGGAPRIRASVVADDDAEARAVQMAYWTASIGPEDLDCAEVHDDTPASEIGMYETLQLVPPGHGSELIETGFTALGGILPINTSGGLLSLGETEGTTGLVQIYELAAQLTGAAGRRQVPGARMGLAHSRSSGQNGRGLAVVTVLAAG